MDVVNYVKFYYLNKKRMKGMLFWIVYVIFFGYDILNCYVLCQFVLIYLILYDKE